MSWNVQLCPSCGAKSMVTDSRPTARGVKRRRNCKKCKKRWMTMEVDTNDLVVEPEDISFIQRLQSRMDNNARFLQEDLNRLEKIALKFQKDWQETAETVEDAEFPEKRLARGEQPDEPKIPT